MTNQKAEERSESRIPIYATTEVESSTKCNTFDEFFQYPCEYSIRIKHVDGLDLERTFKFFEDPVFSRVLLSLEKSGGEHIHGHLSMDNIWATPKDAKDFITGFIKKIYPDAKGNKCLYVKEVLKKKRNIQYVLKEGTYLYRGFSQKFIETMDKCSLKKERLKEKILENEENLLSKRIDYHRFCINYIQIKVDHGQNLYNNHIKAYFNRFDIISGNTTAAEYYEIYFTDSI